MTSPPLHTVPTTSLDQRSLRADRLPRNGAPKWKPPAAAPHPSTCAAPRACWTATAPCCSSAPAPCSPRAATAAPRCARPARTATPPTPSTCCAPGSPGTTPSTCPTPSPTHPRAFLTLTAPVLRAGAHPHPHPARARHPLPLRGAAPPRRPAHRHRARPGQLRLRGRGALAGPRRDAVGPVHHRPAPRAGRRARGHGRASSASTPGCPTPRSPSTNGAGSCTSTPSSASTARTDPPTRHRPGSTSTALRAAIIDRRAAPRR